MSAGGQFAPYRPGGLPMRWQDEVSGRLPAAVRAYLDAVTSGDPLKATDEQLILMGKWLEYYVNAPCWKTVSFSDDPDWAAQWAALKRRAASLNSVSAINRWIHHALDFGLDPL